MEYDITHTTKYRYSDSVPVCHNLVHLKPRPVNSQTYRNYRLLVHPEPFDLFDHTDVFGNPVTYFSIEQAHQGLTVTAQSRVSVSAKSTNTTATKPWEEIAAELRNAKSGKTRAAYEFAFESPRTVAFAELRPYTAVSFPPGRSLFAAVRDLTTRIHNDFEYDPRSTNVSTPIREVFQSRRGVCQDFAHLQLACLRTMGIAARYVSGYLRTFPPPGEPRLVGADASHAWVSVYCGNIGWVDFDPTNDSIPSTDHITLAWGRDYQDVCPVRGVVLGGGQHRLSVSVDVCPVDGKRSQSQQQSQQ